MFKFLQKAVVKLALINKEKLFAMFLERLNKEYFNNRLEIAENIVRYLPKAWLATATEEEVAYAVDLTKKYVEDMFIAIQAMRRPQVTPLSPRKTPRV